MSVRKSFFGGFFGCFGVLAAGLVIVIVLGIVIGALAGAGSKKTGSGIPILPITESDRTVYVDISWPYGSPGGPFTGSIGSGGNQRSVAAEASHRYELPGPGPFVAVIQKADSSAGRILRVELVNCPDGLKHVGETSAPYGMVTVSC